MKIWIGFGEDDDLGLGFLRALGDFGVVLELIWGVETIAFTREAAANSYFCYIFLNTDYYLSGVKPYEVSFLAILTACSNAGQVDQGLQLFDSMKRDYFQRTMKYYAVMDDLFGRAGQLKESLNFI
ncbi:unnamed protein product [Fraxinus pennsylvanica]|uniref:Pentatricopeptide repeat-containing protein n=1 Tax=Fraxinus pennsylvanica TaxID=56036 RepID=A0AAD2DQ43_9LAMI|nr:unnamed protein product [Fraxinus pennsylvanica]